MSSAEIDTLAAEVLAAARDRGLRLATAESCTGGLVVGALTDIAGSSDVVEAGLVTYSNVAKTRLLGVPDALIRRHGAVSEDVAGAMAEGALDRIGADIAVAITGIAGPGGGTDDKPVGLVWFATARRGGETIAGVERFGDIGRAQVRDASVGVALTLLLHRIQSP